jgi:hypothetical protein
MMLDSGDLRSCRQEMVEVTSLPCRVLAVAVASDFTPVQDSLNPPADPALRFRFGRPYGFDRLGDETNVNRLNGKIAKDRLNVGLQRARSLLGMLRVLPAGLVRGDIGFGTLAEGHCLGVGETPRAHANGWLQTIQPEYKRLYRMISSDLADV